MAQIISIQDHQAKKPSIPQIVAQYQDRGVWEIADLMVIGNGMVLIKDEEKDGFTAYQDGGYSFFVPFI